MRIERCGIGELDELARLRRMLWPQSSGHDRLDEIAEGRGIGGGDCVASIARTDTGEAVGFAEASLRHDSVNGCDTSPLLFLEGVLASESGRRVIG